MENTNYINYLRYRPLGLGITGVSPAAGSCSMTLDLSLSSSLSEPKTNCSRLMLMWTAQVLAFLKGY
jgi:hypothetical protein